MDAPALNGADGPAVRAGPRAARRSRVTRKTAERARLRGVPQARRAPSASRALAVLVALDASGLGRRPLRARARAVRAAHAHGQPAGGQRRRAPGDARGRVLAVLRLQRASRRRAGAVGVRGCSDARPRATFVALVLSRDRLVLQRARWSGWCLLLGPAVAASPPASRSAPSSSGSRAEAATLAEIRSDPERGARFNAGTADERRKRHAPAVTPKAAAAGAPSADAEKRGRRRAAANGGGVPDRPRLPSRREANSSRREPGGSQGASRASTLALFALTAGARSSKTCDARWRCRCPSPPSWCAGTRPNGGVGDPRRLPRELLVAARQHPRGRARDGVVGLRVPDQRRREPHDARGRQHLEPRAHRAAREVPDVPGGGSGTPSSGSSPTTCWSGRRATRACPGTTWRSRRTWRGSRGPCTTTSSRRASTWTSAGTRARPMRESLLYRLHSYGRDTEIEPLEHYEEVYQSKHSMVRIWKVLDVDVESKGAFYTLVPIRPRRRGERRSLRTFPGVSLRSLRTFPGVSLRSLRTFPGVSLRPPLAFNHRPRRLSTPTDAYELHPDIALYGTAQR